MANAQVIYPMKRLCDVGVTLLDCEHKTPKPAATGYPYIAIPDIKDGRLDFSNVRLISEDDLETWTRKVKPQGGDIILTRRGRVGDTAVVLPGLSCAIGQDLVILRSDGSQVDQSYLRWALRGPLYEEQVYRFLNVGAVFDSLNCKDIPKFEVPVPPLSDQHSIAHILGSLDDKIELNRQMNETLEAMAKVIFKSWFVDFDPVQAKMEKHKHNGMDTKTTFLYLNTFDHSILEEIPRGWRVGKVSEITSIVREGIEPNKYPDELFEHYSLPAFDEGELPRAEVGKQIKSNKYIVPDGSVLLSKMNPRIPRIWFPKVSGMFRSVCSTEFIVNKPKKGYSCEYLYALFSSVSFLDTFVSLVTGTTGSHQRVTPNSLLNMDIIIPTQELINEFTYFVRPLYKKRSSNLEESKTLMTIRNLLLPKLLSGEIRVKEAEKYIESNL